MGDTRVALINTKTLVGVGWDGGLGVGLESEYVNLYIVILYIPIQTPEKDSSGHLQSPGCQSI